ncbi:MAG: ribonucleotide-diphosphate reductase subunit beta, partial [Pseudomonadota bacterium]
MLTFEDEPQQPQTPPVNAMPRTALHDFELPLPTSAQDGRDHSSGSQAGAEDVAGSASRRISVEDKQIINCSADVNQLVPFKYKWAWHFYLDACANTWMPT